MKESIVQSPEVNLSEECARGIKREQLLVLPKQRGFHLDMPPILATGYMSRIRDGSYFCIRPMHLELGRVIPLSLAACPAIFRIFCNLKTMTMRVAEVSLSVRNVSTLSYSGFT